MKTIRIKKRYEAVRTIASIYRVTGYAIAGLGMIVGVLLMFQPENDSIIQMLPGIITVGVSFVVGVALAAAGEVFNVMMDIEENTRVIASIIEAQSTVGTKSDVHKGEVEYLSD